MTKSFWSRLSEQVNVAPAMDGVILVVWVMEMGNGEQVACSRLKEKSLKRYLEVSLKEKLSVFVSSALDFEAVVMLGNGKGSELV